MCFRRIALDFRGSQRVGSIDISHVWRRVAAARLLKAEQSQRFALRERKSRARGREGRGV